MEKRLQMTVEKAQGAISRWEKIRYYRNEYNKTLMLSSYDFRHYPLNIFLLNSNALKIQHAYFKVRAGLKRIVASKIKSQPRKLAASKSFTHTQKTMKGSKSSSKLTGRTSMVHTQKQSDVKNLSRKDTFSKDQEYDRQTEEKKIREQRIIEARKKYGSDKRKSKSSLLTSSRPASATQDKQKIKPTLAKKQTITDAELQNVLNKAWVDAETEKQKKLKQKQKSKQKRHPLRSQESINEEILVNNIVSKAWKDADKIKKHSAQKKHIKKPKLHSQASIDEENLVKGIVADAWKKVDDKPKHHVVNHHHSHAKPRSTPNRKSAKAQLHSQASIDEENFVKGLVSAAYQEINDKKQKSANKPQKKKKIPMRSQESINEEILVANIMHEAFEKAEELKKETAIKRKHIKQNKSKPKLHSQESIQEENQFKKIVNKAWNTVHHDSASKSKALDNIYENDMEQESSFEVSQSSDGDSEGPPTEERDAMSMTMQSDMSKTRRSRANRSKDKTAAKTVCTKSKALEDSSSKTGEKGASLVKKSPLNQYDSNISQPFDRQKGQIEVSNLDPEFNEEDLLITSPVKENRGLLFDEYLNDGCC